MKMCVLNYSGNTGKTTVAKHVLHNLFPNAKRILVETRNITQGGENSVKIDGESFDEIQEEMLMNDEVILDVGASNINEFRTGLELYAGSVDDFDRFVIPITPDDKIQDDSLATIVLLIEEFLIPPEKIKIIFNQVPKATEKFEKDFADVIGVSKELGVKVDFDARLTYNEFFKKIKQTDETLASLVADKTDYKELIKTAKKDQKVDLMKKVLLGRLAHGVKKEVDKIGIYING